jgi:hypothetical protein
MRTDPRAAAMPEAELQEAVRRMCVGLGLFHFHVLNAKGCAPGWPDSVIIGKRVIFRELKSEHGSLTADQRRVGDMLKRAGQSWAVWRPSDLLDGSIAKELTAVAAVQMELFST